MFSQGELSELRVAIVHDELTRRGGAEVVLEDLLRLWPEADVHALFAGEPRLIVDGRIYEVRTSYLQRLPLFFRRHPARLLPLLPQAAESFDLSGYDLVLSSASGFAKSLVTRVNVPHICYCHTPTRYLWDTTHEVQERARWGMRGAGAVAFHALRMADFAAAARVDLFVANSTYTADRIRHYYRQESRVIHPPIDTGFYTPNSDVEKMDYFLCVGRLTRVKYFDQAVRVCEKLSLPLVVIGTGDDERRLKTLAGADTRFISYASQEEMRTFYRQARAVLQPGVEDFGMAAAEALACGTPVIAVGKGGVLDIVEDQVTGLLYKESREEALAEALRQFLVGDVSFRASILQRSALKLGRGRFAAELRSLLSTLPRRN